MDEALRITPRPALIMCGTTARVQTKTPRRLTLTTASKAASSIVPVTSPSLVLTSCASRVMPALLTSTSMRPCFSITAATARSTLSRLVTSIFGSLVTSQTTAVAPSRSKAAAVARPIPAAPPVMMTTLSLRFRSTLEGPPQSQLDLARRERRRRLAVVRVPHEGCRRVGDGRGAEELGAGDGGHVVVLVVCQVEALGDRFE